LIDLKDKREKNHWQIPPLLPEDKNTAAVREIVHNPGEPTFLAIRKDGQFFLCG